MKGEKSKHSSIVLSVEVDDVLLHCLSRVDGLSAPRLLLDGGRFQPSSPPPRLPPTRCLLTLGTTWARTTPILDLPGMMDMMD